MSQEKQVKSRLQYFKNLPHNVKGIIVWSLVVALIAMVISFFKGPDILRFGNLILKIVALGSFVYAVYEFTFGSRKREQKSMDRAKLLEGNKPAVLIIDCLRQGNIFESVRTNKKELGLDEVDSKMFFSYKWSGGTIDGDEAISIVRAEIKKTYQDLTNSGADMVHLFCGAPMPIALFMGTVVGNHMPIKVYHKADTSYKYWITLNVD